MNNYPVSRRGKYRNHLKNYKTDIINEYCDLRGIAIP